MQNGYMRLQSLCQSRSLTHQFALFRTKMMVFQVNTFVLLISLVSKTNKENYLAILNGTRFPLKLKDKVLYVEVSDMRQSDVADESRCLDMWQWDVADESRCLDMWQWDVADESRCLICGSGMWLMKVGV